MNFARTLSRNEMKNIMAGSGSCRIYSNGSWGDCYYTPAQAQDWYEGFDNITGYCCASCGEEPFENAQPCVA